jgi:hypothetical protein
MRNVFGKKFQRDEPAEARVLGLEDYTHAAAPELFEDRVVIDCSPDNRRDVAHRARSLLQHTERWQRGKLCASHFGRFSGVKRWNGSRE